MQPTEYETALFQKLLYDFLPSPDARLVHNEHLVGRYSGVSRQLDVAVYRAGDDRPFLVADAKRHRRPIDVPLVECFIGMLDDIGAEIGLLAMPGGWSPGAQRRADAAAVHLKIVSIEEALELNWREVAQRIYPWDWAFHPDLAKGLHLLHQQARPEAVIEAIEQIPYEEWLGFVAYGLDIHRSEAADFLWFVAQHHWDDGWRHNALQQLIDAALIDAPRLDTVLSTERDPEILALLNEEGVNRQ